MKVLFIAGSLRIGGISSSLTALLHALCSRNIDVSLYLFDPPGDAIDRVPEKVKLVDIPELDDIFKIPTIFLPKLYFFIQRRLLVNSLVLHLKKIFPSKNKTIQRRTEMFHYQLRDDHICRYSGKTVDLSEKFDVVISWGELLTNYALANNVICKKKYGWIHPNYDEAGFCKQIDKRNLESLDGIVAVSETGKTTLIQRFPEWKDKIYYVENLINVDKVRDKATLQQNEICGNGIKLITVARIQNASKAIDRAIQIAQKLHERNYRFAWYFIGDGEDLSAMKKYASDLGVKDCTFFLGAKENPYPYIRASDLFILQSYYEGKPIVVDEALILGTPVLVTNYYSANQQVNNGIEGLVVQNNERAICSAIASILDNENILVEWRKNLERRNNERYGNIDAFLDLIYTEK